MKKFFFLALIFTSFACSKYEAKEKLTVGGTIRDSLMDGLTISYRVKQEAIDLRRLNALVEDSRMLSDEAIPSSWPFLDLLQLKQSFCYLHKESACSGDIATHAVLELSSKDRKITFYHQLVSSTVLFLDQDVTKLSWTGNDGEKIQMSKLSSGDWEIEKLNESMIWKVKDHELCYKDSCAHF